MNMDKFLVGRSLLYNIQSTTRNQLISSSSFVACFRSTPACFDKWKNKWNNNSSDFGGPKPSKTYTKYKTRQLRADAKKALKDLFNCRTTSKFTLEGEFLKKGRRICFEDPFNSVENKTKRDPLKSTTRRANKAHQNRNKRKSRRGFSYEEFDDDDPETHFHANFGNRQYSWSFRSWEESFNQSKTYGFEWRDDTNGTHNSNNRNRNKWRTISDEESSDDDEPCVVGSSSDRIALGLPMNGPLKIDEVKNAFRLSALKWHPDKNQGPSKALAEEKFKVCVSAYNSLCNALSRV